MPERKNTNIQRFSLKNLWMFFSFISVSVFTFIFLEPLDAIGAPDITFRNNLIRFYAMEPDEIFSNNNEAQSVSEGTFEPEISWNGGIVDEGLVIGDLQTVYNSLTFSRWTKNTESNRPWLWRYRQQKNEHPSQPSFSLTYAIEDDSGKSGRLTHTSDSASWLEVTVIDQEILDNSTNNRWRFFGYARLEFDISNARRSGDYTGTILTTLTYL